MVNISVLEDLDVNVTKQIFLPVQKMKEESLKKLELWFLQEDNLENHLLLLLWRQLNNLQVIKQVIIS